VGFGASSVPGRILAVPAPLRRIIVGTLAVPAPLRRIIVGTLAVPAPLRRIIVGHLLLLCQIILQHRSVSFLLSRRARRR
jgi:hypothetical protein